MRWKLRTRSMLLLFVPLALAAAACGGDATDDGGRDAAPLPTGVTTAGAGDEARLDGNPLVVVRTLPAAAISAETLEPAGRAEAPDGGSVDLARASVTDVAAWEYVSAADEGWRVWRPAIIDAVLADVGTGATLVAVSEEEWPDSCLGLARQDEVCLTVITPGYRVIIEQGGIRIEYHTARVSGFRRVTDVQGD